MKANQRISDGIKSYYKNKIYLESGRRGREIVLDRQNITIEHFQLGEKLKHIECHRHCSEVR